LEKFLRGPGVFLTDVVELLLMKLMSLIRIQWLMTVDQFLGGKEIMPMVVIEFDLLILLLKKASKT